MENRTRPWKLKEDGCRVTKQKAEIQASGENGAGVDRNKSVSSAELQRGLGIISRYLCKWKHT